MAVGGFRRQMHNSAVYACRCCGKRTRETGDDESSVGLCKRCYYEGGLENEHSDGYHDDAPHADCPICKREERA
jgi:rubrerythrin